MAIASNVVPFRGAPPDPASGGAGGHSIFPQTGATAGVMQQAIGDDRHTHFQTMAQAVHPVGLFGRDPVGDEPDEAGQAIVPPRLEDLRKQYQNYVTLKFREIDEARESLQMYHCKQFTPTQLQTMADRGQPPIIFNRIARKINGFVGVMGKIKGDPKCFGRNQPDEHGAEIATQCIRSALEGCQWQQQESELLRKGSSIGIIMAEMGLPVGDKGDPNVDWQAVDSTCFFYDPRSVKLDFSDCRYMGTAKLLTQDEFEEVFPGRWDEAFTQTSDSQTLFDYDKEYLWSQGREKLRLVEHWYRAQGQWRFVFYAGSAVLQYGISPFFDEKGQTISRFDGFAVNIDELGDHYGFVRNFRGPQDALNQHRSKALWIMNTRQLKIAKAALGGDSQNIETKRTEAARADGVLIWENDPNEIEIIPNDSEFLKQTQYYQDAKQEMDSYGPNPSLVSDQGPADISGRSLAMQQQAGIAELGPFIDQWRAWKLRIYRKTWIQQQRYWTAERMLRVTKDMQTAQYMVINQIKIDPYGRPLLVNALGNIDVEILIEEGPDTANVMEDAFDTLSIMGQKGMNIPPPVLIELSSLPRSVKDKVQAMMGQPDPAKQAMLQAQLQNTQADTQKKGADAQAAHATAVHKLSLAHHETHKSQRTQVGAAADQLQAMRDSADHAGAAGALGPQGAAGNLPPGVQAPPAPQPAPQAAPPAGGPALAPGPPAAPPLAPAPAAPAGFMAPGPPPGLVAAARAATRRPVPGGPPVRAPDGHWYIHAPHAGGTYQRVVPR